MDCNHTFPIDLVPNEAERFNYYLNILRFICRFICLYAYVTNDAYVHHRYIYIYKVLGMLHMFYMIGWWYGHECCGSGFNWTINTCTSRYIAPTHIDEINLGLFDFQCTIFNTYIGSPRKSIHLIKFIYIRYFFPRYEWAKRTKFLLTVMYGSPRRHTNISKTFEKKCKKYEIHFYDHFMTRWII